MSYLETLRARRKTPASAWHKLRTSLGTQKFDFYVAFEGEEDEEFYTGFLARRYPEKKFRPLICDGKGGVLALQSEVVRTYGSPRNVFFFIDSDHDRFLEENKYPAQTFSTCGYAIENYIYDHQVLIAGIKKHFQLNSADELCKDIRQALEFDCQVFERRAMSIMSYAVALRVNDKNPNLENIHLNSIFHLEDGGLKVRKIDCTGLLATAEAEPLDANEVLRHARLLRNTHPNEYVRGKLAAQFMINFCRRLAKRFAHKKKLNGKPLKSKIEFGKNNLISNFIDFVEMPDRLLEFFTEMDAILETS